MEFRDVLASGWRTFLGDLAEHLPRLAGALLLLIVGWLVARALRGLAVRCAAWLTRSLGSADGAAAPSTAASTTAVLGGLAFWGTLFVFATAATQILALDAFSRWLTDVASHLPSIFLGALIIFVGVLLGGLVRDVASAADRLLPSRAGRQLAGRLGQVVVVVTAAIVGAGQVGIEVTFVMVLAAIVSGAFFGAAALGIGLGGRDLFGNLLAARTLRQAYRVGQQIEIAGIAGRVVEITETAVLLETDRGRAMIPARACLESPSFLLDANGPGDAEEAP